MFGKNSKKSSIFSKNYVPEGAGQDPTSSSCEKQKQETSLFYQKSRIVGTSKNTARGNEKSKHSVDSSLDVKPPRPYYKDVSKKFDAYDMQDANAPQDISIDIPTWEFTELAIQMAVNPTSPNKMTPILENKGVIKQLLMPGDCFEEVKDGYRVWFHYEMYKDNDTSLKFLDSTQNHGLATSVEIGSDGLPGFYYALKSMKKNEIAEFVFQPKYGYGEMGIPGFIGKNQKLRVIIELVDLTEKQRKSLAFMTEEEREEAIENLTFAEIMEDVEDLVKAGNAKAYDSLYRDACDRYTTALEIMKVFSDSFQRTSLFTPEDEQMDVKSYQIYSNMALCYNRLEEYEEAVKVCEIALNELVHPNGELKPKVLYRYATAQLHLKQYEAAMKLCERGLYTPWGHAEFRILHQKILALSHINELKLDEDTETDSCQVEDVHPNQNDITPVVEQDKENEKIKPVMKRASRYA